MWVWGRGCEGWCVCRWNLWLFSWPGTFSMESVRTFCLWSDMTCRSNVVYLYKCCCKQQFVGKTTQVLAERIKQHMLSQLNAKAPVRVRANDSTVTRHLKESPACIPQSPASQFEILANAGSRSHLDLSEAMFIRTLSPSLRQQKPHTRMLHLIWVYFSPVVMLSVWQIISIISLCRLLNSVKITSGM